MEVSNRYSEVDLQPQLHHASDIHANPSLARTITTLVNEGYRRISPENTPRWSPEQFDRLPTPDSILEALGDGGLFAVVYDPHDKTTPVACAATKQWCCDLEGYAADREEGWEIQMVTTRLDWMRRGLAGRCVDALVKELLRKAVENENGDSEQKLRIWVQTVEDLTGTYWKKKGWEEVRSYRKPVGHWGSKIGYRLLVMVQDFAVMQDSRNPNPWPSI